MESLNSHQIFQGAAGVKVLLVEKDVNSLMYMSNTLEEHSYRVTIARSAFMALSMIFETLRKFDLIISEIDMPGMDGFELLKKISSRVDIPIILISASEDVEVMRKALKEGACFFYYKPIAPHNLVNIWHHFFRYCLKKDQLQKGLIPEVQKYLYGLHGKGKSSLLGEMTFSSITLKVGNSRMCGASANGNGNHIGEGNQLGKRVREDVHKLTYSSPSGDQNQKPKQKTDRLHWTPQLQHKFRQACEILGEFRATPLRIKQLMNEPHLTTQRISSYLQKFRAQMKAEKEKAAENGRINAIFRSQRSQIYLGPEKYASGLFNPQVNIFPRASKMSRPTLIQAPANRVQNVSPNYYNMQTAEHFARMANLPNFWTNPSNFVSNDFGERIQRDIGQGLQPPKPQIMDELNDGLGMKGDNFDMAPKMSAEEIENILHQFPGDGIGKEAWSPGGSVSTCSVNQPSTPRIGTATGGERVAETSSNNLAEDDINVFLNDMLELP